MRILVIAAHPDDELLGVGATLLKHIDQGDQLYVCIVTKAWSPKWGSKYLAKKMNEQEKVDRFVGITKRYLCGLKTVNLNALPMYKITDAINKVVKAVKPAVIYTHYPFDMNKDHEMVFAATLAVTNPVRSKCKVAIFETPSSTEWGSRAFKPNLYVDVSNYIEKKIKALSFYETEMQAPPHPRSMEGIRTLAQKRGFESGVKYAEAFQVIRDYW